MALNMGVWLHPAGNRRDGELPEANSSFLHSVDRILLLIRREATPEDRHRSAISHLPLSSGMQRLLCCDGSGF